MFYIPMFFMLIVTLCSLFMTIKNKVGLIMAGSGDAAAYAQGILGAALFILAIILTVEGVNALSKQGKAKAAK